MKKNAIMFPGQGVQRRGMGKELFPKYRKETNLASDILGYDLEELCLQDPNRELKKTQFTQPALYVINALSYYEKHSDNEVNYFIGHSLGEYNALLAAKAFNFEDGLKIVQKRGELMAAVSGGGMAAVVGLKVDVLQAKLDDGGYAEVDMANFNTPTQIVISGPQKAIDLVIKDFTGQGITIVPIPVSAPFHSRYMKSVAEGFSAFLKGFEFFPLRTPVISNVTGLPYKDEELFTLLSKQIISSVDWIGSVHYLMDKGIDDFMEVNGNILTKMVNEIKTDFKSGDSSL